MRSFLRHILVISLLASSILSIQAGMCNHLGSAAWITRFDGKPVQYMHYLPYGQLLANQNTAGYDERFKFIGKERDFESGYDFFGARFYIPPFIHFGSTEPLLDKYLHISPYSYAAWNPIKYYDFNGNNPRTGRIGELQNGIWRVGADATFLQQNIQLTSQQMNNSVYAQILLNKNKGTLTAAPSPKENLLNSLNPFEASMIQSPIIQGVAAGLLVGGSAIMAADAAVLLNIGGQIQGLTLQGINVVEGSSALQIIGGGLEGYLHSKLGLPPDFQSVSVTPLSKFGYYGGQYMESNEVELLQNIGSFVNQIITFSPSSDLDN